MSDTKRLIEKLGLAIYGEDPALVLGVLAAFARQCCEEFGVHPDTFIRALFETELAPKRDPD